MLCLGVVVESAVVAPYVTGAVNAGLAVGAGVAEVAPTVPVRPVEEASVTATAVDGKPLAEEFVWTMLTVPATDAPASGARPSSSAVIRA